jgi:uncharacterized protein (TIGR02231 family)
MELSFLHVFVFKIKLMKFAPIMIAAFVSVSGIAEAQTAQKLTIEGATVFLRGAQLSSTARVHMNKGENEFIFTNVAGDVNDQSLTVSAGDGVVVESATFQNNYLVSDNLSPRAKELKDSVELVTENRSLTASKIAVLTEQITILQDNRKVSGSNTGLSVAELTKMLDLVNTKMEGYLNQKNKQEMVQKKTDLLLTNLNKQLDEERKKDFQPGGQLLVKFYAKETITSPILISYLVPNAGWTPNYDVRVDDINQPAKLFYKANVYQNSGVRWDNVRLSLSTGNPQEGVEAPVMNPWYLAFAQPIVAQYKAKSYMKAMANAPAAADGAATYGWSKNEEPSSMNEYVTADNSGVNTTFDIDLPYSVANDGKPHMVAIKQYDLPATYRYYAAPKLDKDAFLQAQITNWEDLNLIPGQTNIFYEGTYVGQGYLDMRNVKDTMTVSLGRDKKLVIKREQDKKLRSVKTIGTQVRETFAYTIIVRNTRKQPINLVLQDQQPVSNDKDIVIEDKEYGGAEYDETTGMMKWTMTVNPNESKSVNFGYTIKYPKGKQVSNLR